jgi:hypothetical protein
VACDSNVWWRSLDIVKDQVGVREATGRNDGPRVEAYLRAVGLPKGNPWCMAVHVWSFAQVTDVIPIARTGLVRGVWNHALAQQPHGTRYRVAPSIAWTATGDLLIWGYLTSTSGHVERQVSAGQAGWVVTAAGNTTSGSSGNQRDGGGMYYRRRNLRHPLARMVLLGAIGHRHV